MNGFRLSKSHGMGVLKLSFNPPSVRNRSLDLGAVTIVTRFLRNYLLPYPIHTKIIKQKI